ncbi:hypothetical protein [Longispora albida]|uniref:hypothetical protein n=1 Tax=Longispora albida TaxID=203523 RepID=UPI00036C45A6|nr:hypothetical protein [Longispora albida]
MKRIATLAATAAVATAGVLAAAAPAQAATVSTCSSTFSGYNGETYKVCVYKDGQNVYSFAHLTGGSPFKPLSIYKSGVSYVVGGATLGQASGPGRLHGYFDLPLGDGTVACGSVYRAQFAMATGNGPFGPTLSAETTVSC